jgi:hypothetical protein
MYGYFPAIKTALKQENLNPEIEEKLLQLQRYQERQIKQGKQEVVVGSPAIVTAPTPVTPTSRPTAAKKRPAPAPAIPIEPVVKDPLWEPSRKRSASKSSSAAVGATSDTKDTK